MFGSFSWTPSHFFQWKRDPGRPSWRDVCSEAEGPIIKMSNYASWRDIIRWSVKGGLDHLSGGKKGLQPDIKVENYIIQWNEGKVSEIFFWGDTFSLKTKRKHVRLSVSYPWRPFLLILKKERTWPHAPTKKWKSDRAHLPKNENLTPQTYQKVKKTIPQTAKNDQNTKVDLTQPHKSVKFMKTYENRQRGTTKKANLAKTLSTQQQKHNFLAFQEHKKMFFCITMTFDYSLSGISRQTKN